MVEPVSPWDIKYSPETFRAFFWDKLCESTSYFRHLTAVYLVGWVTGCADTCAHGAVTVSDTRKLSMAQRTRSQIRYRHKTTLRVGLSLPLIKRTALNWVGPRCEHIASESLALLAQRFPMSEHIIRARRKVR